MIDVSGGIKSIFRRSERTLLYKLGDLYLPVTAIERGQSGFNYTSIADIVLMFDEEDTTSNIIIFNPHKFESTDKFLSIYYGDEEKPFIAYLYYKDTLPDIKIYDSSMKITPASFGHTDSISLKSLHELLKFQRVISKMYMQIGGVKINIASCLLRKRKGVQKLQFNLINGMDLLLDYHKSVKVVDDSYVLREGNTEVCIGFGNVNGNKVVPIPNDYQPISCEFLHHLLNEFVPIINDSYREFFNTPKHLRNASEDLPKLYEARSSYYVLIGSLKLKLALLCKDKERVNSSKRPKVNGEGYAARGLSRFILVMVGDFDISYKPLTSELSYWHTSEGTFIGNRRYNMGNLTSDTTLQIIKE